MLNTIEACNAVVYSIAFSSESKFLAVGDDKSAIVYKQKSDSELDEGQYEMKYRLRNGEGNRVTTVGFALPFPDSGVSNDHADESYVVFGSFDKTVTVLAHCNENGPPVALIDDSTVSFKRAIEFNKLLPVITHNPFSLMDRALSRTFVSTGEEKKESYATLRTLLDKDTSPMGPMAIQARHFMMAIAERDEELLELLLGAACRQSAPLRLRFEAVQMICSAINSGMGSAVSAVFKDLELESTGCEMHVRKQIFDKRTFTNIFDKTNSTKAIASYDHTYAWQDEVLNSGDNDAVDSALAKCLRVSLPALSSRMVLSRLIEVERKQGRIELWGSKVISTVLESVYKEKFRPLHNCWTLLFLSEFILFMCYTALLNGDVWQFAEQNRNWLKKWLEIFLGITTMCLTYHQVHQHLSIWERVNWKLTEHLEIVNIADLLSQLVLGSIITYGLATGDVFLRTDDDEENDEDDESNKLLFLNQDNLAIALACASFLLMIKVQLLELAYCFAPEV